MKKPLDGGKGSDPRTSNPDTRKAFQSGYDAIDWSKKDPVKTTNKTTLCDNTDEATSNDNPQERATRVRK